MVKVTSTGRVLRSSRAKTLDHRSKTVPSTPLIKSEVKRELQDLPIFSGAKDADDPTKPMMLSASLERKMDPQTIMPEKNDSSTMQLRKKLKQFDTFGMSPFPQWKHPTPQESQTVCDILAEVHGLPQRPTKLQDQPYSIGASCGQTPEILDALVSTILSQNTNGRNSSGAKRALDEHFGRFGYDKMRQASVQEVAKTIESGGLANIKAARIKNIIDRVYQENKGDLSMSYIRDMSDEEAMRELVKFDGVGPKTAACVLLFCIGRESFAVDTHIYRLTKKLGWIPPTATREQAYAHLDTRIPAELKYPLHVLLIKHGKSCPNCNAQPKKSDCPLKEYKSG
ncbi:hypothetical protein BZG36_00638 [Bifiguratus adelaidae]|uniref:HhH-GPD domain-containing protein n=1 Tax=Bifiguratus adelaidae TaxID=1938954 RepID=A0A261Y7E3_9FUNG|nr:hypothetical protein BZG36_00638 [Bifiguratus adelaidae]